MQLAAGSEFIKLPFAAGMAEAVGRERDFSVVLHEALQQERELPQDTIEVLRALGPAIGRTALENQLRVLQNVQLQLKHQKTLWEEKTANRGGLSRRLGVLGGLLAVVILL